VWPGSGLRLKTLPWCANQKGQGNCIWHRHGRACGHGRMAADGTRRRCRCRCTHCRRAARLGSPGGMASATAAGTGARGPGTPV